MTLDEARALLSGQLYPKDRQTITVRRAGATWTGKVTGVMAQPSLIIETDKGPIAVGLEGLTVDDEQATA